METILMEWKKAPEELVEFIAEKMKDKKCDYRKMFGYPAYFINGNMFVGVFGDKLFLRLSESDIVKITETCKDISAFEPMHGRPMKGYVFCQNLCTLTTPCLMSGSTNRLITFPRYR
jgi:TfoX/Sxy family transcriptional regulator of competence genes